MYHVVSTQLGAPPGTSLRSLVAGFVLTKQTEGKSPRTVEYYQENLKRFIWYSNEQGWSDYSIIRCVEYTSIFGLCGV